MDTNAHNLTTLFEQLGLPSSDQEIERFIIEHRSRSDLDPLADASFWSPAQASFIKEAWEEDSDWCEAVDELNTLLHS